MVNFNSILIVVFSLLLLLMTAFTTFRRIHNNDYIVLLNYNFFLLILSSLYLLLPIIIKAAFGISLIPVNIEVFNITASYSLWFCFVFYIGFVLSKPSFSKEEFFKYAIKWPKNINVIIYCFCVCLSIISLFILLNNFSSLMSLSTRIEKYDYFMNNIFYTYRYSILFNVFCINVFYICLVTRRLRYLFLGVPFVLLDLIVGNRNFIFQFIVCLFFVLAMLREKNVSVFKLGAIVLALMVFSFLRELLSFDSFSAITVLMYSIGEFFNTRESQEIAYNSHYYHDFFQYFKQALVSFFPSSLHDFLVGPFYKTIDVIDDSKGAINFGLGSSLVSDAILLSNGYSIIILIYPVFMVAYGFFLNKLMLSYSYYTLMIYLFSVIFTFLTIRYGFFHTFPIAVYFVSLYGAIYLLLIPFQTRRLKA